MYKNINTDIATESLLDSHYILILQLPVTVALVSCAVDLVSVLVSVWDISECGTCKYVCFIPYTFTFLPQSNQLLLRYEQYLLVHSRCCVCCVHNVLIHYNYNNYDHNCYDNIIIITFNLTFFVSSRPFYLPLLLSAF